MKNIVLKSESCIGCGACVGIDAEHFEFSEDGYSVVKSQDNLDSPLLADAIDACPVAIISIEENDSVENKAEVENQDCCCNEDTCHCDGCHCHESCTEDDSEEVL